MNRSITFEIVMFLLMCFFATIMLQHSKNIWMCIGALSLATFGIHQFISFWAIMDWNEEKL